MDITTLVLSYLAIGLGLALIILPLTKPHDDPVAKGVRIMFLWCPYTVLVLIMLIIILPIIRLLEYVGSD